MLKKDEQECKKRVMIRVYTAISTKVVGESARDNLERHCGWF